MLRKALIGLMAPLGLALTGLIAYSYFFLVQPGPEGLATPRPQGKPIALARRGQFLSQGTEVAPDVAAPALGFLAPDFVLPTLEGERVALSDFRGKPVLLNFWATWCPPCRKEIPDLQKFHEQYGDRIVLLGINYGEAPDDVRAFLERYGVTYLNLLDREGTVLVRYRLTGLPTSFWLDERGVIRGLWLGAMSFEDMVEGARKTTRALGF